MKNKKIILGIFASMLVLFFTACENATSYDYSDVIPNTENQTPENPIGTGTHSFSIGFETASNPLPANFEFQQLTYGYVGATDTTGDGFEVIFTLTLDVPDTLIVLEGSPAFSEGSQNVKVTIDPYVKTEGIDYFPLMYFNGDNNLRTFTFTPTANTVQLTARYSKSDDVQRGVLPLAFTYNATVYEKTMLRTLQLSVFSNGNVDTSRVVLQKITEQVDTTAVVVDKPDNFILRIEDTDFESTKNTDYTIPLVMSLSGIHSDYPISLTAKDTENIRVSDITIVGGIATFNVIHSGIEIFDLVKGAVTLTVDSPHADKYSGLPFDVVINTERDETFKYYIDEYANKFTVSTSTENLFDEVTKKYYTIVSVPSMDIAEARPENTVIYEIFRKDDSSADFKLIDTQTVFVNKAFTYKDYDAFILRNPEQEYKIKLAYSTYSNNFETATVKKGSRMLTDREVFIAAMETIRVATNKLWYKTGNASKNTLDKGSDTGMSGTYYHGITWTGGRWQLFPKVDSFSRYQLFNDYNENTLFTLNGTFLQNKAGGSPLSDTSLHGVFSHGSSGWTGDGNFQPRTDKLTASYAGITIEIVLNNIKIDNDDGNAPAWSSGSFKVTQDGVETEYDNASGVPFGFFMDAATFRSAIVGDDYTQQ